MFDNLLPGVVTDGAMAGAIGMIVVIVLLVFVVALAYGAVSYVLHSLGLYAIAKRRCIRNPWLAWIPVGNLWLLGSISDQYQYVAKGNVKNLRKLLLSLSIAYYALYAFQGVSTIGALFAGEGIEAFAGVMGSDMLLSLLLIVMVVVEYIAYYNLYSSCQPSNATLYTVLSVIFSVTLPFFVFACRKKDLGMPPRKQPAAPVQIVEPVEEPAEELAEDVVTEEDFAQPEEIEE